MVMIPKKSRQAQLKELDRGPFMNTKDPLFYKDTLVKEAKEP